MADFGAQLEQYKQAVDADIAAYAAHVRRTTLEQYGEYGALVTNSFLDFLSRGGKRIRGALAMIGYEMCGGRNRQMIARAATAIELIHAHLLVIDDIQDRSSIRRGKPTVHEALTSYHQKHRLRGDSKHVGIGLALNAAFGGNAAAQMLLAGLDAPDELKLKVLSIVNLTIGTTAHGQTQDIINEAAGEVTERDINCTMEWKTANYTILNPLCVGMVLAGAGCEDTDAIRGYALAAGRAFQISDDILSTLGNPNQTGKSNMDDIREGRQTLLTVYALEHASGRDKAFLRRCLGNDALTSEDFARCQQIMERSGAHAYATAEAESCAAHALADLDKAPSNWRPAQVAFLRSLVTSLTSRIQ